MDLRQILKKENLLYQGKSKDVYRIADGEFAGKYAFVFSDRAGHCRVYRECIQTNLADGKRTIKGKNQLDAAALEKIFLNL